MNNTSRAYDDQLQAEDCGVTLSQWRKPVLMELKRSTHIQMQADVGGAALANDASDTDSCDGILIETINQSAFDLVQIGQRRARHIQGFAKRAFDVVGALFLALVFSPLILFIAIVLACTPGKALFRHCRIGQHGNAFNCLKFQTMVPDADRVLHDVLAKDDTLRAEWERDHKLRDDPRITWLGRFLRRTSLDELPQLWNVLRGDMSLVGPRPIVTAELPRYGRRAATYLQIKPGLTGYWQVNGRSNTSYRRRVAMDVMYARNANLMFDLYILAMTARVVLLRYGAY